MNLHRSRPSQLVYLDNTGYRLALDSTDELSFIEARSGTIDNLTAKKTPGAPSNNTTSILSTGSSNDGLLNVYDESGVKNEDERDESIDYNMGWDEFPNEPER